MSLTLGLSVFADNEASEPRYLWRQCENRKDSKFYDSELVVENVFERCFVRIDIKCLLQVFASDVNTL